MTRLPPLDPAVAATRLAVRGTLLELARWGANRAGANRAGAHRAETPDRDARSAASPSAETPGADTRPPEAWKPAADPPLVLVALSGGADSLALAAAVAFEAPRAGIRAGAVIVDHGLQTGSGAVADRAATQARGLGLDPVRVARVEVHGGGGPEAAARAARYAAYEDAVRDTAAACVLTAHTRDDQAEQVLLALARGSGTRAIAGIPPVRDSVLRPFLGVTRAETEAACRAQGLAPWSDPHNADPRFTRVRVRERILPVLEAELGPGVVGSLARSAELAREDADALDALAGERLGRIRIRETVELVELDARELAMEPAALRNRIIRAVARDRFGSHFSREHTRAVAGLVTDWHGQGPIHAPGIIAVRAGDRLRIRRA